MQDGFLFSCPASATPLSRVQHGWIDACLSHHLVAGLRDLRVPPQANVTRAGGDLLDGEGHAERVHHGAQLPALSAWPPGRGQLLQAHDGVGD